MYILLFIITILLGYSSAVSKYGGPCCPVGWTLYNADSNTTQPKCARAIKDWNTNFAQSEKACDILGGRLVSIHSAAENKIIYEMITGMTFSKPNYVWIGLTKNPANNSSENGSRWYWSDGAPTKYTNWLKGFPSMQDFNSNCAIMYTKAGQFESKFGEWRDVHCDAITAPYVCEKLACVCGRAC